MHFQRKEPPSGIYCLMDPDTLNLLLHLKQLSKPISSDLRTSLLYLLDALSLSLSLCARARARACVCVCACVRVSVRVCVCVCDCVWCADPIILVFVPGVEYGFLCVYNVM